MLFGLLAVVFGGMWWMSNRAKKQQQEQAAFRDNLQPGQEVMTGSGAYGVVVEVESDTIILELSPGVETRWAKAAVHKLIEPEPGATSDDDELDDELDDEFDDGDEPGDDVADDDDASRPTDGR